MRWPIQELNVYYGCGWIITKNGKPHGLHSRFLVGTVQVFKWFVAKKTPNYCVILTTSHLISWKTQWKLPQTWRKKKRNKSQKKNHAITIKNRLWISTRCQWVRCVCFLHLCHAVHAFYVPTDNYGLKNVACCVRFVFSFARVKVVRVFIDHLSIYEI